MSEVDRFMYESSSEGGGGDADSVFASSSASTPREVVKYYESDESKCVPPDYERTLEAYILKLEDVKQQLEYSRAEKAVIIKERDQALDDLNNVETAFSDVHRKYERSKSLLLNLKENEAVLIERADELGHLIEMRDRKLDLYLHKANEKVSQMYQEYEAIIRDRESQVARLRAQCRFQEMKLNTLESDVHEKTKENVRLNILCNELINGNTRRHR